VATPGRQAIICHTSAVRIDRADPQGDVILAFTKTDPCTKSLRADLRDEAAAWGSPANIDASAVQT